MANGRRDIVKRDLRALTAAFAEITITDTMKLKIDYRANFKGFIKHKRKTPRNLSIPRGDTKYQLSIDQTEALAKSIRILTD